METKYFDNCRIYLSTDKQLIELAKEGLNAINAWIMALEETMGYKEDDLAIMVRNDNMWLAGVRKKKPGEEGWRKQDSIWVPRMSTKAGKAINANIQNVGSYHNIKNKWLTKNNMAFMDFVCIGPSKGIRVELDILTNKTNNSFVICVPLRAPESMHTKAEKEYGGKEITTGTYCDQYRDHIYIMW